MPMKTSQTPTCTRDKCGVIICYSFLYSVPPLFTDEIEKKKRARRSEPESESSDPKLPEA